MTATTTTTTTRLLPLPEVERLTGFRKSKLFALVAEGAFPRPCKIGRASRWVAGEVECWVAEQIAKRDAQPTGELVDEQRAAAELGKSVSFLQKDRLRPDPRVPFVRRGSRIFYGRDQLRAVREGGAV